VSSRSDIVSEKKIKVTDKRLFTPEGELRNEYRHLEEETPAEPSSAASPPTREPEPGPVEEQIDTPSEVEAPPAEPEYGSPTFFDLVGVVAQPIALYLGDAKMPDGESLENLELARLYIDLLEILYKKSEGNLTAEEGGFLKDLLYQLRVRYVEKSG